jgi:O-antigen ligase
LERWDQLLASDGLSNGRITAFRCCMTILPDSGWFGTGPGTFRLVFPYYTPPFKDLGSGVWTHAHQDYLQGLIEWGYVGFLLWVMLFGGAIFAGIRQLQASRKGGQLDIPISVAMLALALLLLHALVDFPLQIPSIQYVVVFYLALLWSVGWKSRRSGERQKKPPFRKGGLVMSESRAMTKSHMDSDDLPIDQPTLESSSDVPGGTAGFPWDDSPVRPSK